MGGPVWIFMDAIKNGKLNRAENQKAQLANCAILCHNSRNWELFTWRR